ncbi:MAG: 1-deoxy-D-xylulose-5-phosphate reductoisomerase [Bacteroidetes bacterium 4572_128]|nr:MAG: 1-deoxy-D-xylulose-5-phosphate reductoisomerase [Bacteroidetes bacterium 4572_128]
MEKKLALLGSTGSIGQQTLQVIREYRSIFEIKVLTANENANLLIKQSIEFLPDYVVINNKKYYNFVKENLKNYSIKVLAGKENIAEIVKIDEIDIVLTAMVGYSGLLPTINAINSGKNIALANKETLVVAGELINKLKLKNKIKIIPVDSEHSAIFQCLIGEENNKIEKIYLTASGGPFRGKDLNFLKNVTKSQALKHPNWKMGNKITIDSASLMNKGLEVIEAKWLFNLKIEQIDIIVHPQSIIHSIVQFEDGSMKAQMGLADMKLPIQYALSYPHRLANKFKRFNFLNYPNLTFEKADKNVFKNLGMAYFALKKGGNTPCILNAANEIAVEYFLKEKISFLKMSEIIEKTILKVDFIKNPDYDEYVYSNNIARKVALDFIKK